MFDAWRIERVRQIEIDPSCQYFFRLTCAMVPCPAELTALICTAKRSFFFRVIEAFVEPVDFHAAHVLPPFLETRYQ